MTNEQSLTNIDALNQELFANIVDDLVKNGYSIRTNALPVALANTLYSHVVNLPQHKLTAASIGRKSNQHINHDIRNDKTMWINHDSPAGAQWLEWAQALQQHLNRHLFKGLHSFESHFSHYAKGSYYKRHFDAFKGQANRVVSLVTYLNPDWRDEDGGELCIYTQAGNADSIKVIPQYGTIVIFLSEEFEHEVKPTLADRYAIAGWFVTRNTRI